MAPDAIIDPGGWGHMIRLYGYRHTQWPRELALEQTRIQRFETYPSRLDCVFGLPTEAEARAYQRREAAGFATDYLFEIEPVDHACPQFFAPLDVLEAWNPHDAERPARYWGEGHWAGQASIMPANYVGVATPSYEVLIGGQVRVLRRLE